ncbi:MAG: dual specificity protein phosphatase [Candidatus Parvarchaeum sp.]
MENWRKVEVATRLYDELYVGNIEDALNFEGEVITVLEYDTTINSEFEEVFDKLHKRRIYHIPVLEGESVLSVLALEGIARLVKRLRKAYQEKPILIHCWGGMERSPIASAWVLWRNYPEKFPSFVNAYDFVKSKRKVVLDRMDWFEPWVRNGLLKEGGVNE